jgi:hypothetical protein
MPNKELNFNSEDFSLIGGTQEAGTFGSFGHYIRLTIRNEAGNVTTLNGGSKAIFYASPIDEALIIDTPGQVEGNQHVSLVENDFTIYQDTNEDSLNYYIKPNEILSSSLVPEGNYTLQTDFLLQYKPLHGDWTQSNPPVTDIYDQFIIKQISPSRKEVRLKLLNSDIKNDSQIVSGFKTILGDNTDDPNGYNFKHVLYVGDGLNIPIVNYIFDKSTDGEDSQSIILRLYEPLPTNIKNLTLATVEKEVLITQVEEVFYFSDIPPVSVGGSLSKDTNFSYELGSSDAQYQNLDELTGSLSTGVLNSLITGSSYDYPNLNVDYTAFSNHTFFGSAEQKLVNFRTKIKNIQNYYSDISHSLDSDGSSVSGDSQGLVKYRKNLFNKVQQEIDNFTPYEKFLYFDGQSESTASAPGLGKNYADNVPVANNDDTLTVLEDFDGFNLVYKHETTNTDDVYIDLFSRKYRLENKPFYNYSSSIYLSFLCKGDENINHSTGSYDSSIDGPFVWQNYNGSEQLPNDTLYQNRILNPDITGSEYRRFIYQASGSYWVPTNNTSPQFAANAVVDWGAGSSDVEVFSASRGTKTGSNSITADGKYSDLATVQTGSGIPFKGSIMPSGELFRIWYIVQNTTNAASSVSSSLMTNVSITLNNPTDVLPFDNLYHTSSTGWTNWYDGTKASASAFDKENIHSLKNNLPTYIQESSEYDDFKKFLALMGEHYDVIRNHVDGLGTLHNIDYNKTNSVPPNLLPILLDNMGWEAISPFSSSLAGMFNTSLSSTTSDKDVSENTWRKALNNLIYLYKSKGTKNSVRALMNIYGYPADILQINEFGGSNENQIDDGTIFPPIEQIPTTLGNNENDTDLINAKGNNSFIKKKKKLRHWNFNSDSRRIHNFDWWMNDANPNTIEFVYKHVNTTNNQRILRSSGSGALWDLSLNTSNGISSSFEFRINNTHSASFGISSSVSMSTPYNNITDGQLINVMLQRFSTSSLGFGGVNEYRLYTAVQDGGTISNLSFASMSISGSTVKNSNYYANENWASSGSRHALSASNLFVGEGLSGSLAEFRTWETALQLSKFRLHTLNKLSTVGNSINSHKDELIYHYKFNENYSSGSITASLSIVDANPNKIKDYSLIITDSGSIFTGSLVYGSDFIDTFNLGIQDNSQTVVNDKKIIINPKLSFISNINPHFSATRPLSDSKTQRPQRTNSNRLEINTSPQDYINSFILDHIQGTNLELLYGSPTDMYEPNYKELDDFRKTFFDSHEISVDINKYIRAQETLYNPSLIDGIQRIVPARSTLSDSTNIMGVTIKPTILEKQKYEKERYSVETNPNTASDVIEITKNTDFKSGFTLFSSYETSKDVTIAVDDNISFGGSKYEHTKDTEININNLIVESASYNPTKDTEININNLIVESASYEATKDVEIDINNVIIESASYNPTKDTEININNTIVESASYEAIKDTEININNVIIESASYNPTKDTEININNVIVESMSYNPTKDVSISILPSVSASKMPLYSGSNTYVRDKFTKGFRDLHAEWGRGDGDTHFISNTANDAFISSSAYYSASFGQNVRHIEPRYVFHSIGDVEQYSGSKGRIGQGESNHDDFSNSSRFYNHQIITEFTNKNITHDSYIHSNPGTRTGRAMGKTRYFYTGSINGTGIDSLVVSSSDWYATNNVGGDLILPSNHVRQFSNPFSKTMYKGTQNTNPGFQQPANAEYEDYSSASFYRVKVTGGEQSIIIKGTGRGIDEEGSII